jgi:hypothetical protein
LVFQEGSIIHRCKVLATNVNPRKLLNLKVCFKNCGGRFQRAATIFETDSDTLNQLGNPGLVLIDFFEEDTVENCGIRDDEKLQGRFSIG